MKSFWLSFCSEELPHGEDFLGASIVRATSDLAAVMVAHREGCNPGGQVMMLEVPADVDPLIGDEWRSRLLTREECETLDAQLGALRG